MVGHYFSFLGLSLHFGADCELFSCSMKGVPLWQLNPLEDPFCVPERHPPVPEAEMDTRPPLALLLVQHQGEAHHAP